MKSKQFLKCRDYIFNFIQIPSIPSVNNASGRGIRKLKIKLKNSGYFRSYPGTSNYRDHKETRHEDFEASTALANTGLAHFHGHAVLVLLDADRQVAYQSAPTQVEAPVNGVAASLPDGHATWATCPMECTRCNFHLVYQWFSLGITILAHCHRTCRLLTGATPKGTRTEQIMKK